MPPYRNLKAWEHAERLAVECVRASRGFPEFEQHSLADQLRRAAYSVPLNIAEGTGRKGPREFRRFLGIALGSLHELEAVLELVESLEYIPSEELAVVKAKRADCARMVYGLIQRFS